MYFMDKELLSFSLFSFTKGLKEKEIQTDAAKNSSHFSLYVTQLVNKNLTIRVLQYLLKFVPVF